MLEVCFISTKVRKYNEVLLKYKQSTFHFFLFLYFISTSFYDVDLNLMHKMVPCDPRTIFLVTYFTEKMLENLDSIYLSILMLESIWTEFTRNFEFVQIQFRSTGTHNWNKIHNFKWIWSTSGKYVF